MAFSHLPDRITVMTWNVANGMVRPDRLAAYLRAVDVDVIGLQEVSPEQEAALLAGTEATHPHRILSGAGFHGRGLLSRFPIRDSRWLDATPGRPDLLADVEIGEQGLAVLVGHPLPPRLGRRGVVLPESSRRQVIGFASVLGDRGPGVLLADLNMTPRNPLHAALGAAGLVDAHQAAGSGTGRTFPVRAGQTRRFAHPFTWLPLPAIVRFDYIWHTRGVRAEAVWTGDALGSDHRPVLARLILPDELQATE